jgi:hypothetical protein
MSKPSDYRPGAFEGEQVNQKALENATFTLIDARIIEGEFGPSALCQIKRPGQSKEVTFLNGAVVIPTIQNWLKDPKRAAMSVTLQKDEIKDGKTLWVLADPEPDKEPA